MAALADKSSKPETCPHQMPPVVEARVVELRRMHPGWGPRSIHTRLAHEGFSPVPSRRGGEVTVKEDPHVATVTRSGTFQCCGNATGMRSVKTRE